MLVRKCVCEYNLQSGNPEFMRSENEQFYAAVLGAIAYYIVIAIVLQLGLSTNDLKLFSALIVALFLAIPHLKSRYFAQAGRKGGKADA